MRDRHVRIEFFLERGSPARRRRLALLGGLCTVACFVGLAVLLGRSTWDEWRYQETSMAIGVPRWWYSIWMPVSPML